MISSPSRHLVLFRALCVLVLFPAADTLAQPDAPSSAEPHPQFPVDVGRQLSPPIVHKPIHECAEAVHVTGFIPHAVVRVYANGTELIGEAIPPYGFTEPPIRLTRPLKLGEKVTATQTVGPNTSSHSTHPVTVDRHPTVGGGLKKPTVHQVLYDCGHVVPVDNLVESVRVRVFEGGSTLLASTPAAGPWHAVWTPELREGRLVTAQQVACEDNPAATLLSPLSDAVRVRAAPSPVPPPSVRLSDLIVGNDAVTLDGLLVGAHIEVFDRGVLVGGGYATSVANWVPINARVEPTSVITATQGLCASVSDPSPPGTPSPELPPPIVLAPICNGQQYVVVRETIVNAGVIIFRNGNVAGYGGAGGGDVVLALGGGAKLATGDVITARQYMGMTLSAASAPVTVVDTVEKPAVEILGGETFFLPEPGETAIAGPVFPRGRGGGPLVTIQSCCNEGATLEILDPSGAVVATPPLTETFPGYFTARWGWESFAGWTVPDRIPVGRYSARVKTNCGQQLATKAFFVIFNPADVGGPNRFSFNEVGVWFGAGNNRLRALPYHLHPDDARVFNQALSAASGMTDSSQAAEAIARLEETLFAYSLSYHTNDVLDMLANYKDAQCADDANVLTALLRSVGIPAHPATADAALETGDANWTFDTWVEVLAPWGSSTNWHVYHPHEDLGPQSRSSFGQNVGVATKSFNDLVVMADTNWVWSEVTDSHPDVSYGRLPCGEPEQHITKAAWVHELCEDGYWALEHWICPGRSVRESGLDMTWGVGERPMTWGGALSGTLEIRNLTDVRREDRLRLQIVADLPESKQYPDEVLSERELPLDLRGRGTFADRFRVAVPVTTVAGANLSVRVCDDQDLTLSSMPLAVRSQIDVLLDAPTQVMVGEQFNVTVQVSNAGRDELQDINLRLESDPSVSLIEGGRRRQIKGLVERGRSRQTFVLEAVSPVEATILQLSVRTANGGSRRLTIPLTVIWRDAPGATPTPVFRR